jgi:glycosyltransferase involved in cell wall biosynthesis
MTPVVIMTDAFYRRQRWQAATVTAFRGVVVTWAAAEIVGPIFPHSRLIGPMPMPISRARLDWLDAYSSGLHKPGDVVQFIGHVYSPRKEFLDLVAERLAPKGINLRVNGDKWGTSNEDYWRTLADADIIVTTTMQGPDRPIVDWNWVQQAVFRFAETMAAGTALVASEVPGITRFFAPGKDFLQFVSVDDAVVAIERLVRDDGLRRAVTEAGHAKATALVRGDVFWTVIDAGLGRNAFS